jgi:hypothetical protein
MILVNADFASENTQPDHGNIMQAHEKDFLVPNHHPCHDGSVGSLTVMDYYTILHVGAKMDQFSV